MVAGQRRYSLARWRAGQDHKQLAVELMLGSPCWPGGSFKCAIINENCWASELREERAEVLAVDNDLFRRRKCAWKGKPGGCLDTLDSPRIENWSCGPSNAGLSIPVHCLIMCEEAASQVVRSLEQRRAK